MNTLEDKLKATILATSVLEEEKQPPKKIPFALKWIPASVAVAVSALLLILPHTPEDTFDSPEMAYAEVERVFSYISEKIETGSDIADRASEPIAMIKNIF